MGEERARRVRGDRTGGGKGERMVGRIGMRKGGE